MSPHSVRLLAVLVLMAPLTARVAPAAGTDHLPTVPTGAGFSLSIARAAAALHPTAARLQASGLPAYPRHARRGSQVIVGPYVAIDEVEAVQRQLAARGFRARLLVDESVRREPGEGASILLVSGGGRLSLVIELASEPRYVFTRRDGAVLEVDASPAETPVETRAWRAPSGVSLLERVSMEATEHALRTRVVVSDTARTNVRVVGRRLYIDLWSVESELVGRPVEMIGRPASEVVGQVAAGWTRAGGQDELAGHLPRATSRGKDPPYNLRIAPALARFQSMEPFVLSSVAAPSPDVLAALEGSLRGLEARIQEIEAPAESARAHAALVSAVRAAIEAVQPSFGGDRMARAREAYARVKAATSYQLPATS